MQKFRSLIWIRPVCHFSRNHYDRLGHFFQGFVPALISREIFIRRGIVKRGPWLAFIVVCISLAISASYELFEAYTAMFSGAKADSFLGTQGDPWDTQWDMTWALIGAVVSVFAMRRIHDRQLEKVTSIMMGTSQKKSFWALMVAQFFGAFNDNVFKVLVTLLIVSMD